MRGEGDRALKVESRLPHFLGLTEDMFAAEIILYTFREGITTIGGASCEPRPDIVLSGPGIEGELCAIEHKVWRGEERRIYTHTHTHTHSHTYTNTCTHTHTHLHACFM